MSAEDIEPNDEDGQEASPKILTKPLPEILDEMEKNIHSAARDSRRAEAAAKEAKEPEEAATSAARQAATRAEEASVAAREAAELAKSVS